MIMNVESEEIYGLGHRTSISIDGEVMMEQFVRPGGGISMKLGKPNPCPKPNICVLNRDCTPWNGSRLMKGI